MPNTNTNTTSTISSVLTVFNDNWLRAWRLEQQAADGDDAAAVELAKMIEEKLTKIGV